MKIRSLIAIAAASLILVTSSVAQAPAPAPGDKGPGYVMLDRGSVGTPLSQRSKRTHTLPMNTLDVNSATLMLTMVSIGFFPVNGPAPSAFIGNFFAPVADFPTSYVPFFVTGAFAWGTGPPTMVTLGAGVAPGPFPVGTGMWADFATAGVPGPPAMTSGFFGGTGIFPHSPPTVTVGPGLGVACGIYAVPAGGAGAGAIVVTPALDRPRFTFNGPPISVDFMSPSTFFLDNNMASGCFITGATVPVELQAFSVD